jgi:hypothetical protein
MPFIVFFIPVIFLVTHCYNIKKKKNFFKGKNKKKNFDETRQGNTTILNFTLGIPTVGEEGNSKE